MTVRQLESGAFLWDQRQPVGIDDLEVCER